MQFGKQRSASETVIESTKELDCPTDGKQTSSSSSNKRRHHGLSETHPRTAEDYSGLIDRCNYPPQEDTEPRKFKLITSEAAVCLWFDHSRANWGGSIELFTE